MPVSHRFARGAKVGHWAVLQVAARLVERGFEVEDLQADGFHQTLDIDLYLPLLDLNIEVKGDTYTTGNVYLERISNVDRGTPGCVTYTVADELWYYFVAEGWALVLNVVELQEWLGRRLRDFPEKYPRTAVSGGSYASIGHTVPVTVLEAELPGAWRCQGLPVWRST